MMTLRVTGALGWRAIKQTLRRPQMLAPLIIFPSLFLAINVGGAGSAVRLPGFPSVNGFLDFEVAGILLQATMMAGTSGGIALAMDIESGFFDRLVCAPVPRLALVLGRLAGTVTLGVLQGLYFLVVALAFGAHVESGVAAVPVVLGLAGASALAFGGATAALALKSGSAATAQGIFPLVFVVLFLSSAFFPRGLLTEPARSVAGLNPMSYIAEGVRNPIIDQLSAAAVGKGLLAAAAVAALTLSLSLLALRGRLKGG